ncbi:MAG: ATP synthase F1 subunit epsilon [Solirubrobacterales bacterium]
MATTFPVEVMTPDGAAYSGEVEMVSTRTVDGSLGIKANHEPLMAMLNPAELRLHVDESDVVSFAQGEGYLQMANNQALLLVEEATPVAELKLDDLNAKLEEATGRLESSEDGSAAHDLAERDIHRIQRFIEIAESQ